MPKMWEKVSPEVSAGMAGNLAGYTSWYDDTMVKDRGSGKGRKRLTLKYSVSSLGMPSISNA